MTSLRTFLSSCIGTVLFSCADSLHADTTLTHDIEFAKVGDVSLKLDLHVPSGTVKAPLIVYVHGGAWRAGDKEDMPLGALVQKGFAVASVDYRLSGDAPFPTMIHDIKAAIRFLRAHGKEHGLSDTSRIAIVGSSAGGHLVALLGVAGDKKEWDKGENLEQSSGVQAVVDWFGPTNLLTMGAQALPNSRIDHDSANSPESKLVGGPVQENKSAATAASPVTYASAGDAPMLLVHGDRDNVVPPKQSEELYSALKKAGVETTLTVIPGAGHGDGGFREPAAFDEVRTFFRKHLNP